MTSERPDGEIRVEHFGSLEEAQAAREAQVPEEGGYWERNMTVIRHDDGLTFTSPDGIEIALPSKFIPALIEILQGHERWFARRNALGEN